MNELLKSSNVYVTSCHLTQLPKFTRIFVFVVMARFAMLVLALMLQSAKCTRLVPQTPMSLPSEFILPHNMGENIDSGNPAHTTIEGFVALTIYAPLIHLEIACTKLTCPLGGNPPKKFKLS